jgi:hypothetical protein
MSPLRSTLGAAVALLHVLEEALHEHVRRDAAGLEQGQQRDDAAAELLLVRAVAEVTELAQPRHCEHAHVKEPALRFRMLRGEGREPMEQGQERQKHDAAECGCVDPDVAGAHSCVD